MADLSEDEVTLLKELRVELGSSADHVADDNLVKFLRWKPDVSRASLRFRDLVSWQTSAGSFIYEPHKLRASDDAQLRKLLLAGIIISPNGFRDKNGSRLLFGRLRFNDMSDGRTAEDICRMVLYNIENALSDPDTQHNGIAIFHDMREVSRANVSMGVPKLLFSVMFGKMPVKMKSIYLLNAPWFVTGMVLPVVRLLMPEKLRKRIFVLSSVDDLYEHIEKDHLFEEHGGTALPHDQAAWLARCMEEESNGKRPPMLADCKP